jgi:hypothetical protein
MKILLQILGVLTQCAAVCDKEASRRLNSKALSRSMVPVTDTTQMLPPVPVMHQPATGGMQESAANPNFSLPMLFASFSCKESVKLVSTLLKIPMQ